MGGGQGGGAVLVEAMQSVGLNHELYSSYD